MQALRARRKIARGWATEELPACQIQPSFCSVDAIAITVVVLWLATFIFVVITGSSVSMIFCEATYRHCIGQPVPGFEAIYDIPGAARFPDQPAESPQPGVP